MATHEVMVQTSRVTAEGDDLFYKVRKHGLPVYGMFSTKQNEQRR